LSMNCLLQIDSLYELKVENLILRWDQLLRDLVELHNRMLLVSKRMFW